MPCIAHTESCSWKESIIYVDLTTKIKLVQPVKVQTANGNVIVFFPVVSEIKRADRRTFEYDLPYVRLFRALWAQKAHNVQWRNQILDRRVTIFCQHWPNSGPWIFKLENYIKHSSSLSDGRHQWLTDIFKQLRRSNLFDLLLCLKLLWTGTSQSIS